MRTVVYGENTCLAPEYVIVMSVKYCESPLLLVDPPGPRLVRALVK